MASYLYYNEQFLTSQEFNLPYDNRAFQYNDGFFDTLLCTQNHIRFLPDHLDRMQRASQVLGLQPPPLITDAAAFNQATETLLQKNALTSTATRVKVNIWRQTGGLFTPDSDEADLLLTVQLQSLVDPVIRSAAFYTSLPNRYTPFSFFKGPYALHYVQAGIAKKKAGVDEVILLDEEGNISECLASNIFWIRNNQVFTPSLQTGCVAGIMRLQVLRLCQTLHLPVQEGFYKQAELLTADFIFTSNITGLRTILSIAGFTFAAEHPIYADINKHLAAASLP